MSDTPKRPKAVPKEAWWNEEDREWEHGPKNAKGEKHGKFRYWREDGTLCNECQMVDGAPHGPFKRFHESGEISQEGAFKQGQLHGPRTFFASDQPTTEKMPDGLPEEIRKAVMIYNMGQVVDGKLFNAAGERVLPDGSPFPTPPEGLPDDVQYNSQEDFWYAGGFDPEFKKTGLWRRWSAEGQLQEECEYQAGEKNGTVRSYHANGETESEGTLRNGERQGLWRFFDESGVLVEEVEFQDDAAHGLSKRFGSKGQLLSETTYRGGRKQGTFREAVLAGAFQDSRIRVSRGEFDNDCVVGIWTFRDDKNELINKVDLGIACANEEVLIGSPVFANEAGTAEKWEALANQCFGERRMSEAVCASARVAATKGKADSLRAMLAKVTVPMADEPGRSAAGQVLQGAGESMVALANALVRGPDAADLLRGMAVLLDQKLISRAALDYVNAALLLAPDRREYFFTRSLIQMSLGNDQAASQDAAALEPKEPDNAAFLKDYIRVLFPVFDFWPSREKPSTHYDGLPEKPAQELEAIREILQKYVTRLQQIREAMKAKVTGEPRWMLPDLSHLLPEGPQELGQWQFEVPDADDPDSSIEIEVDETINTDGAELPALLRMAREDWNSLTWLCWSMGLDRVAMPKNIKPPKDFGTAAGMAAARLWRCRDKRVTGGYAARQQEIPTFSWEGMDIDSTSSHLASMAEGQYAEMQALFYWLSDADNKSPWQDNLRGS